MNLHIAESHLRKLHSLPEDFHFFKYECFPKGHPTVYVQFTGAITYPLLRGPRKGKPNWRKRSGERTFVVLEADYPRIEAAWVREMGLCTKCVGKGKEFVSWSKAEGSKFKECTACSGSGKFSGGIQ